MFWKSWWFLHASLQFCLIILVNTEKVEKCFCHLTGLIDDCLCDIETLEKFNNDEIFPIVDELVKRDFFRYYKVNLLKKCLYFDGDTGTCGNPACGVKLCPEEELPEGLRNDSSNEHSISKADEQNCQHKKFSIGDVNGTLSNTTIDFLDQWDKHDDSIHRFCDLEDENSANLQYVDLLTNPERYTGYKGPMAWRIWKAIYEENCFLPETISKKENTLFFPNAQAGGNILHVTSGDIQGMCLEKRVFYRVISGLHTSINMHLCMNYLVEDGFGKQQWKPNLDEFQRRFDPSITKGEGTVRLKNLYFIYLLELRALSKVFSYFDQHNVVLYTGKPDEDNYTKELLVELLKVTKKFPMHFDEDVMFKDKNAKSLKKEFARRFLNVTHIIDCVTCEKCRLWGKLQTQGLGTALKVLFSGKEISGDTSLPFRLLRQEVVSLINAFARLSNSIKSLETLREMIHETSFKEQSKSEL